MRDVGRAVEDAVDAVTDVGPDHAAIPALGVLLDDVAELAEQRARLHLLDGFLQTLSRSFHHPNRVGVSLGLVADIIRLVQVAVIPVMVQGNIQVDDITVEEDALVRDTVADDLVDRRADGLGEVVVV
jgi:hypothetical protein